MFKYFKIKSEMSIQVLCLPFNQLFGCWLLEVLLTLLLPDVPASLSGR